MRYFEAHEAIYARRLGAGAAGWDDGAYDAPALRDQVERWLAASKAARPGARILELGCGTGALGCMLAQRGFDVTGIDISPSAISFARSVAAERAIRVHFEVAEACTWKLPREAFDIVVDSHLLHCLTLPGDRAELLVQVTRCLAEGGEFWTETMVAAERLQDTPSRRFDERGTVWARIASPAACTDAVQHDASWWMPTRYIAPDSAALLAEFSAANLEVIEWAVQPPSAPAEAADFRARFRRSAT
jgi:SAM-dependent methyltransferase